MNPLAAYDAWMERAATFSRRALIARESAARCPYPKLARMIEAAANKDAREAVRAKSLADALRVPAMIEHATRASRPRTKR